MPPVVRPLNPDSRPLAYRQAEHSAEKELARLRKRTSGDLAAIRDTAQACARLLAATRASVQRAQSDTDLTNEAQLRRAREIHERAVPALDGIENSAREAAQGAYDALDAAEAADGGVQAELLRELRISAAWQRTKPRLDRGTSPIDVAREAGQAGDEFTMRALQRELPAYFRAQGRGDRDIEEMQEAVEATGTEALPPAARAARQVREEVAQAAYFAHMSLGFARHELETGQPTGPLPVTKDELVEVDDIDERGRREYERVLAKSSVHDADWGEAA